MNAQKTYTIKGMVCNRCVSALQNKLQQNNLNVETITLGKVQVNFQESNFDEKVFSDIVSSLGFSLAMNKNSRLVEQVKAVIRGYFENLDPLEAKPRFSEIISQTLNMSYDNIGSIFTAYEKTTIENYIILYRIELVKSLLQKTNITLTDISYKTGFSSVYHLSKQFKKVTGLTPSDYREVFFSTNKNIITNSSHNTTIASS